jgi:hypothetical protein
VKIYFVVIVYKPTFILVSGGVCVLCPLSLSLTHTQNW